VKKWQVLDKKIMPNDRNCEIYSKYYMVYKSIYQNLKEDMKNISDLI
jgi:xylulokinase